MSLANQQFLSGRAGLMAYSGGDLLAAGSRVNVLSFDISGGQFLGLSIGLGISDQAAWSALNFELVVGGKIALIIEDEICTLLQKEFFPMDLPDNTKIELFAVNNTAAAVTVAALIRAEAG